MEKLTEYVEQSSYELSYIVRQCTIKASQPVTIDGTTYLPSVKLSSTNTIKRYIEEIDDYDEVEEKLEFKISCPDYSTATKIMLNLRKKLANEKEIRLVGSLPSGQSSTLKTVKVRQPYTDFLDKEPSVAEFKENKESKGK